MSPISLVSRMSAPCPRGGLALAASSGRALWLGRALGLLGLCFASLLPALGGAGSAVAAESVSVQLRARHQFASAGYYVALEKGYYRQAGLAVELRAGGPGALEPIDAVAQNKADFGISNAGVAAARMNGKPLVALAAVLQHATSLWLMQPRLAGEKPERLARRRLMGPLNPEEAVELLAPFAQQGVRPADLRQLQPSSHSLESFVRGEVDLYAASATVEPGLLAARGVPFEVLRPQSHGVDHYGEVLFTSERLASQHPSRVERFTAATLRGWAEAFRDIEGTARLIHERWAPETPVAQLSAEGQALRELARYLEIELGHMSRTRWTVIAEQQRALGFGTQPLDVSAFLFEERQRSVASMWPDPVRIALAAALLGAVACLLLLLRQNRQLKVLADAAQTELRDVRSAELRFHFLMDVAPFPILIFDVESGHIHYANERALGWLSSDPTRDATNVQGHFPPLEAGSEDMRRLRDTGMIRDLEMELPRVDSASVVASDWCLVTVRLIDYQGSPSGFATFSDISSRKNAELELRMLNEQRGRVLLEMEQLQGRLREASLRDTLTGLFNRRYFDTTLARELARCRRSQVPLSLLVIDADHFKRINDTAGHAAGDEVLRTLAEVLTRTFRRAEDVVCRYGGEEFAVVLPGATREVAMTLAEAARVQVMETPMAAAGEGQRITVSIGVVVSESATGSPEDIFKLADAALYEAKRAGRNQVVLHDNSAAPPRLEAAA